MSEMCFRTSEYDLQFGNDVFLKKISSIVFEFFHMTPVENAGEAISATILTWYRPAG